MYLILDTSQNRTVLAIVTKKEVLAVKRKDLKGRQSLLLLSLAKEMLEELEANKKDLEGIIIVTGPGSYTGLRIGISTVNSLGFGLDIPVSGISKYEIGSLFYKDKFFAVPSYQSFYLVARKKLNKKKFDYQMVDGQDLVRIRKNVIVVGKDDLKDDLESFDYQGKSAILLWSKKAVQNLKKQELQPFYFQKPNITT